VIDDTGAPVFDAPRPNTWTWLHARNQPAVDPAQCPSDRASRRQCAYNGVQAAECARRGCCFDNSTAGTNVPICFYSTQSAQDLVFLGHGAQFKQALQEFTQIAGKIPAPPRYQFGVYFSRYCSLTAVWSASAALQLKAPRRQLTGRLMLALFSFFFWLFRGLL
jgi:hypothetical protein